MSSTEEGADSEGVERSRWFHTDVLGGVTVQSCEIQHETEIRGYMHDPDGRVIEVGQTTRRSWVT